MTTTTSHDIGGHIVTLPVQVRDASAGTATFEVDAAGAQALLPDDGLRVVESAPGRAQLTLAVVDYRDNDLGDYDEIGITLFVTPRGGPESTPGTCITHLPVNQQFSRDAGIGIWGFPKTVEDITLDYGPDRLTAALVMDGRLVLRISLPRGGEDEQPEMAMTTYTVIDGQLHATDFRQGGRGARVVPGGDGVVLELGDHPLGHRLAELGLPSEPQLTTWTEHLHGRFEAPRPL